MEIPWEKLELLENSFLKTDEKYSYPNMKHWGVYKKLWNMIPMSHEDWVIFYTFYLLISVNKLEVLKFLRYKVKTENISRDMLIDFENVESKLLYIFNQQKYPSLSQVYLILSTLNIDIFSVLGFFPTDKSYRDFSSS